MIQKNLFMKKNIQNIMWTGLRHGVICGANIKPIKEKAKRKLIANSNPLMRGITKIINTWAIYLHVRMDNGDQIDLIFKMYKTGNYLNDSTLINPTKFRLPVIPRLLEKLSLNEWVELIGTEVFIDTKEYKEDTVAIVMMKHFDMKTAPNRMARVIHPNYFEIHKDFFNK